MSAWTSIRAKRYIHVDEADAEGIKDVFSALDKVSELKIQNITVTYDVLSAEYRSIYYWISTRYGQIAELATQNAVDAASEQLKILQAMNPRDESLQNQIDSLETYLEVLDQAPVYFEISRGTLDELLGHCEQVIAKPELAATLLPGVGFDELTPAAMASAVDTCTNVRDALRKALNDPFLKTKTTFECNYGL